jgi:hypothetical protein
VEGVIPLENSLIHFGHFITLIHVPIIVLLLVTSHVHSTILFTIHPLSWSLHYILSFTHSYFLIFMTWLGKGRQNVEEQPWLLVVDIVGVIQP